MAPNGAGESAPLGASCWGAEGAGCQPPWAFAAGPPNRAPAVAADVARKERAEPVEERGAGGVRERRRDGKRPTKSVLDDLAVSEVRDFGGDVVVCGRDGDQAAIEAKATAQPAGVSSSIREAGCVATRSRTSLKYRKGSIPASLQPWASV